MWEKEEVYFAHDTIIFSLCLAFKLEGCPRTTRQARMTSAFDFPVRNLQMAHLLMMENNCANSH